MFAGGKKKSISLLQYCIELFFSIKLKRKAWWFVFLKRGLSRDPQRVVAGSVIGEIPGHENLSIFLLECWRRSGGLIILTRC